MRRQLPREKDGVVQRIGRDGMAVGRRESHEETACELSGRDFESGDER
jgi:hypothetical protein